MKIERFEIKEEHLTLLSKAYIGWNRIEFGAPTIDPKRPYGNSNVERDIADILGWITVDDGISDGISDSQRFEARKLHEETKTALQICLIWLKFETGVFESDDYGISWKRIS